ncbi:MULTISPECIES: AAA family ATPase [unclassified Sphingomonas]|uniref:ExeA family protein n=1 Tax=unclassified Sphingomonas TaxID=196159 RepID=UPI0022699DBE|nr:MULTISPECIES: AAA family ATPase [unclassified Sphingomonas]
MYDNHYGLSGRPFQLTPDAKFWYETATHRKAMAYLGYGLAQGEGFIVITGDIGAGKTTLMGHLTDGIDPAHLNVIQIVSTAIEADDLLRIVATGLAVDPKGLAKAQLLTAIERGLHAVARSARRTLLIVDEAQALPVSALEELRMLSNFQAGGHALLQIVLLGQPEFRDRLHGSDRLEQLRQRVIAIHHLDPMEEHEVADYIAHRLSIVGWQGRPDFAVDAFEALYRGSGGVPRRLNLLAGRVMLHAAIEDLDLIDASVVRAVLRDLAADLPLVTIEADPAPLPIAAATEPAAEEEPRRFTPRTDRWLNIVNNEAPEDVPEPETSTIVSERLAALEARVDEQDAALRRVLTLLVDWVESDRTDAAGIADQADYAPIRRGTAWGDAA